MFKFTVDDDDGSGWRTGSFAIQAQTPQEHQDFSTLMADLLFHGAAAYWTFDGRARYKAGPLVPFAMIEFTGNQTDMAKLILKWG